jgi:hypothetical protein
MRGSSHVGLLLGFRPSPQDDTIDATLIPAIDDRRVASDSDS